MILGVLKAIPVLDRWFRFFVEYYYEKQNRKIEKDVREEHENISADDRPNWG